MNMLKLRNMGVAIVASGALLLGCTDGRKERLEGAERALAALPDIEVIKRDPAGGLLTVRSRRTGAVANIDLGAAARRAPPGGATSVAAAVPPEGTATAGESPSQTGTAAQPDDAIDPAGAERDALAAAGTAAAVADAAVVADGSTLLPAAAGATVVRDLQGRVQKMEGSGFSIERSPTAPPVASPAERSGAAARSTATATATAERRRSATPIVCSAGENRVLERVDLDVPGAGIVAERGCTLTIANVRVRSGGWGLVVNAGASVRIDDSLIEGRTGALDLYPGGSLSAWATTFRGALGRPAGTPQFVDRGGNAWQ